MTFSKKSESGARFFWHRQGNPAHPPILCLHGQFGLAGEWTEKAQDWHRGRFVIAPDLPGHGMSPPPGKNDSIARVAEDLLEEATRLADPPYTLMGYSLGGRIAMRLLKIAPQYFDRTVLLSSRPGLEFPPALDSYLRWHGRQTDALPMIVTRLRGLRGGYFRRRAMARARLAGDAVWADRLRAIRSPDDWRAFYSDWYAQPIFGGLHQHRQFVALTGKRMHERPLDLAKTLMLYSAGRQENLWPALFAYHRPVLYLYGERDPVYADVAAGLRQIQAFNLGRLLLGNIAIDRIPGCGHALLMENPDETHRRISRFLERSTPNW